MQGESVALSMLGLNESPRPKAGKSGFQSHMLERSSASMKVPARRRGNNALFLRLARLGASMKVPARRRGNWRGFSSLMDEFWPQ